MPVSLRSRYAATPSASATAADGKTRPTIGTRLVAPLPVGTVTYQHVLSGAESLESLAFRYFGSSAAWWRIADANSPLFPLDLQTGTAISIPSVTDVGRIERSRSF